MRLAYEMAGQGAPVVFLLGGLLDQIRYSLLTRRLGRFPCNNRYAAADVRVTVGPVTYS
jgi:hypothetical protein